MSRNAPGTEGAFSTDARHASDLGSASLYAASTGKPGEQTNIATSTKNDAVHIMLLVFDSSRRIRRRRRASSRFFSSNVLPRVRVFVAVAVVARILASM